MTKFSNHSEMAVAVAGQALQRECHKAAYEAGWWHQQYGAAGGTEDLARLCRDAETTRERLFAGALISQKLALIHSEVSEALEGARKNRMDDHLPHRKSIEVELADAVIRIADLAGALGLDLGGAIAEKMAYNAQRADHKPENRAAAGGKAF
jgi:NTP pyrophosphatase (non-canonical NTP hydrolase)